MPGVPMLRSDGRAGAQPGFSPQILEQSCRGRLGTIWTMLLRALVPPWCSVLGPGAASLGTFPLFPQPEQPCMPPASGGSPSTPRYTTEQRVLGKQLLVVTGEVPTAPRKPRLRDVPTCVLQRGGTGGRGRQVPSTPSASWGLLWHTGGQDHPQGQESALKVPCAGCPTPPSITRELPGSPVPPRHRLGRGKGQKSLPQPPDFWHPGFAGSGHAHPSPTRAAGTRPSLAYAAIGAQNKT